MNFANRLKQLRKEHNLTQEELAQKISKTRSTIAGYETERKEPDYETLALLAKYFNVSLDYLMGVSDVKNPYSEKSIEEEYKEEIQALEKFRQVMINKGLDYENKTYEELAEIVVKHIKVQDILNSDNSKSN